MTRHFKKGIAVFIATLIFSSFPAYTNPVKNKYLSQRISPSDKRYDTFVESLRLMEERGAQILVETGTSRGGIRNFAGDGGSTVIFSHYAFDHNALLFSVDIDKQNLKNARLAIPYNDNVVRFIHSDSIEFLKNFGQPIDFLYLDSFDYDVKNPSLSQRHHLNEIIAAYDWLHSKTIIMIDDCDLPQGGKGKLAINFLLKRGWKIIKDSYQVILVLE